MTLLPAALVAGARMTAMAWLGLLLLSFALQAPTAAAESSLTAERVTQAGVQYDLVWVDLRTTVIDLFWKDGGGEPFRNFWRLRSSLQRTGRELEFATNAGIFGRDETPLGLHIEHRKTLRPLNRGRGGGNFFLKPNGVFWIEGAHAHIDETEAFAALAPAPTLAVQSGPLLVHRGNLHPKLDPASTSRYLRNGVGLRSPGMVVFAISSEPVNLHAFGTLFRTTLGCTDALYLDGSLSEMYVRSIEQTPPGHGYVGILAVTRPVPE